MIGLLGGVISMPVVVGQLFDDIGGFLFGAEFIAALANLITTILTTLFAELFLGLFGTAG